jgi:hypothetical protein
MHLYVWTQVILNLLRIVASISDLSASINDINDSFGILTVPLPVTHHLAHRRYIRPALAPVNLAAAVRQHTSASVNEYF